MKMFKKNGGFTLVELIVVIAILAILAGVAIPVYSGYVAKAEKAGDMQLLGAVNQAYAAAMLENGVATADVLQAVITLDADNSVKELQSVRVKKAASAVAPAAEGDDVTVPNTLYYGASVEAMAESFMMYFAGNEDAQFKVLKRLAFNPNTGLFCDPMELAEEETVLMYFGDTAINISGEDAARLANSSFAEGAGSELLLGKVESIANIAESMMNNADMPNNAFNKLIYDADETYLKNLAATLGFKNVGELYDYLDANNAKDPNFESQFLSNSLVLTAASNTSSSMDTSFLSSADMIQGLKTKLDNTSTASQALAEAAMAYGMYTAYANSTQAPAGLKDQVNNLSNSSDIYSLIDTMAGLQSDGFQSYLNSQEGKDDLAAYQSAMNMINTATQGNSAATKDALTNGFMDSEMQAALAQIMGK